MGGGRDENNTKYTVCNINTEFIKSSSREEVRQTKEDNDIKII